MWHRAGLAILIAAIAAPVAVAADAPTSQDARCLIIVSLLSRAATEPKMKASMVAAGAYYMGRVKALEPQVPLKDRMRAEVVDAKRWAKREELERCAAEILAFQAEVRDMTVELNAMRELRILDDQQSGIGAPLPSSIPNDASAP